jgi:hypothetical protein
MNENDLRPITDEDRRLAESKKLTLDPIHTRVVTDDVPDEQIATNHLVNPPIANAPNDTEQNSQPMRPVSSAQPTTAPQHYSLLWQKGAASLVILAIFIIGGIITGIVFFMVR